VTGTLLAKMSSSDGGMGPASNVDAELRWIWRSDGVAAPLTAMACPSGC